MKVLICEDDVRIRKGLATVLEREGYEILEADSGPHAFELFVREMPDFICLDVMLPEMNGYDVCRLIRSRDDRVPIIFITARIEEIDRVLGLELGADDYIVKPFGVNEVVSRIRTVARRCYRERRAGSKQHEEEFMIGDLLVKPRELLAYRRTRRIDLSLREVKILYLLHRDQGMIVDRHRFFDECWGIDHVPNSRTLEQHISKLRRKIGDDPKSPLLIETVHGVGYRVPRLS